ncbi:hypothetical protein SLS58_008244 [Diplodia intermedia]|uniref:Heterokaryon incompatibility domain-containing protein n=1 Tax=Diplodia intermedia TaxID=856260 RepID=A0ABR3TI00_9PEZI
MASSDGPFGDELAKLGYCSKPDWTPGNKSRILIWRQLLSALQDAQQRKPLLSKLSRPQRVSLELSYEWWREEEECYPDSAFRKGFHRGSFEREDVRPDTMYRRRMEMLWDRELTPLEPGAGGRSERIQLAELDELRQTAATCAAAHRTALAAFKDVADPSLPPSGNGRREAALECIADTPIPACVQPCAWLSKSEESGYPHYLWDVEENKTVECPPGGATYVVVSHTWGRWHQPRGKQVKVDGVPWMVPVNTLFDVTRLPSILRNVPFETRYIWLDLVCIPQDGSRRQAIEIARQAAIFASAKWATIWFNQANSWDGLRAAVEWMSMKYLQELVGDRFGDTVFDSHLEARANVSTGLVTPEGPTDASVGYTYDGWFTSLWTLQEACMRPDLFLCNKHWEPLKTKKEAQAITLDHLIGLFTIWFGDNILAPGVRKIESFPWAVQEVEGILARTAMHKLLEMSPIDILVFGDQRYCEDNQRAKAIMSALGVTNWFFNEQIPTIGQASSGQVNTPLVEGRYPFAFINEARERFGALFFTTGNYTKIPNEAFRISRWNKRLEDTKLYGTMLPFSIDGLRRRIFSPARPVGFEDHPSVRTWQLHPDGSVHIPQAGILASWPSPRSTSGIPTLRP